MGREYNLSKEPLKMDLLVIKKKADRQVSIAANRELYEEIRRGTNMCDALRDLMKDVIEEEVRKGMAKERQRQQNIFVEAIKNLMANTKWTAEQAMSALNIPMEEWGRYKALM